MQHKISKDKQLTIGIVGFGTFGQFLAKRFVQAGHRVLATSRTPYFSEAAAIGAEYFEDADDFCEEHPDIVILASSILSTEPVLRHLPLTRLKRSTLIVDVLSVKVFPKQLRLSRLPPELDILCTHPMFGPLTTSTDKAQTSSVIAGVFPKQLLLSKLPPELDILCTQSHCAHNPTFNLDASVAASDSGCDPLLPQVFPKQLLLSRLPPELDILCTHPMFGPDSGKGSWEGLNFMYEAVRVGKDPRRQQRLELFLDFWRSQGCRMVEMTCEEHDRQAASTQFVTHTVGRMLGAMDLASTDINTKGYENLLQLVNNTKNDSFELYYGLFLYNTNATDELERLEKAFDVVKKQLFGRLHDIARKQLFPAPVPNEQQPRQQANGGSSSSSNSSVRSASSSSSSMSSLDSAAAAAVNSAASAAISLANGVAKGKAAAAPGAAAVGGDFTLVDKGRAKGAQ
uniref:Prephenate/arogenate dehydrogenase domain-containing protein n=1 Tax=Tetradesmus obliquus TaxID=3088 RepID=A0A383WE60_TETOB|eukprot:jgi/Sobl393_1/5887/SZX75452.1